MKYLSILVMIVIALSVCLVIAGQLGFLAGKAPQNLGVIDGKLQPPSLTPNSVSSQAAMYPNHPQRAYAETTPLTYSGEGKTAMDKLASILQNRADTRVVTNTPDYIYAQSTTKILKFTDDLEFWLDSKNSVIQLRSASRMGSKDMGVNRARIEAIRAQFSS